MQINIIKNINISYKQKYFDNKISNEIKEKLKNQL